VNNNPFLKPVLIIGGVFLGFFVVGKFFAPKDAPAADPAAAASPAGPSKEVVEAGTKKSPPDGPAAKLGPKAVKTATGLQYEDIVVGTGAEAADGKTVDVHYTGTLTDGTKFDSSRDRGEPYSLTLPGQVIKGWNEGIPGMKVGGKRKLVIPPALGYGDQGQGGTIPPGATLVFEVELMAVK